MIYAFYCIKKITIQLQKNSTYEKIYHTYSPIRKRF